MINYMYMKISKINNFLNILVFINLITMYKLFRNYNVKIKLLGTCDLILFYFYFHDKVQLKLKCFNSNNLQ